MRQASENQKLTASVGERVFAGVVVSAMTAGAIVVRQFDPTHASIFPACPLLKFTGIACPGCGLTRGFHALFHGDVVGALDYNLILPGFFMFFLYVYVSHFLTLFRGYGLQWSIKSQVVLWAFFAIAIVFAVLRNLPFYPFSWMYP